LSEVLNTPRTQAREEVAELAELWKEKENRESSITIDEQAGFLLIVKYVELHFYRRFSSVCEGYQIPTQYPYFFVLGDSDPIGSGLFCRIRDLHYQFRI
jgi:hypothetical protein